MLNTRADRYLEREVWQTLLAVVAVMLMVMLGGLLTDVLSKIARGKVPAPLLFSQIGLRIPDALTLLLPLSSLLAVLLAYGRMYRDSEMSVLAASGYGVLHSLRPLLRVGLVLLLLQGALSLWLAPWGRALAAQMVLDLQRSVAVAGLSSGRFVELPGQAGVLYVARVGANEREIEGIMLVRDREGQRLVLTARRGELLVDEASEELSLRLEVGERVDGRPGEGAYRRIRFESADIAFPRKAMESEDDPLHARSSLALLAATELDARVELLRRLTQPLALLLLILLAPIMAQGAPRQPRYDKLVVAVLLYVAYINLIELSRVWRLAGVTPEALGSWWVHALFAVVVLLAWTREILAWRRGRLMLAQLGVRR